MTDEMKQARREYYRDWRKKNPDKVRESQERFWARKFEQARCADSRKSIAYEDSARNGYDAD